MELRKRTTAPDCRIEALAGEGIVPGGETFSFTFDGETHRFYASAGVGSDLLGDLVECLYKLYIAFEHTFDDDGRRLDYDHNDPAMPHRITGVGACLDFDPAGPPNVFLHLHRELTDDPEIMLDVSVEYLYKKRFDYHVSYYDLCYVVAREVTKLLKEFGFIGLRFQSEIDCVDLHHLLNVKHLGMCKQPLSPACGVQFRKHTLAEELELLCFDL